MNPIFRTEKLFTYDELTENMRQKSDPEYANILERIRINTVTGSDIPAINKQKKLVLKSKKNLQT